MGCIYEAYADTLTIELESTLDAPTDIGAVQGWYPGI